MKTETPNRHQNLTQGIPDGYWDAIGFPPRCVMMSSGLGPASAALIRFLEKRCDSLVYLDLSYPAARQIRQTLRQSETSYIIADPLKSPLRHGHFDLAISFWSAHHSPDLKKLLAEIFRIISPGGQLLLVDGLDRKGTPAQELHRQIHQLSIALDQASNRSHGNLMSPSELIELVQAAGFRELKNQVITDSAKALDAKMTEALRDEIMRVLTKVYPQDLSHIQGGRSRYGKRLAKLTRNLESSPLELHPYVVLHARKPTHSKILPGFNNAVIRQEAAESVRRYRGSSVRKPNGYKLRFRDLPAEFKPREKMVMNGPESLKNHELLAVLLGSGTTRENVIELSKRLIKEYGSRAIAQERSVRRLKETLGIGTKKACQIVAAFELGRRFFEEPRKKTPVILAAEDAYEYLKEMAKFTREHFRGLYLNTRGRVIRDEIISIGSLNMSVVHPREVFLPAVEFSAAAVILAHNHPSGDPTPSDEDLVITQQMVDAGRVMNIEVFDHIIIGDESYVSLQREGKLTGTEDS